MIRALRQEDFKSASDVLWKSFYFAEKNHYSMEGMERFRDLTSPISLAMNTLDGSVRLFGYFCENELIGVGAVKDRSHILLLFVLPGYARQGAGSALLCRLESECEKGVVTLNASDGAVLFYQKRGYRIAGARRVEEEMVFTPMEKTI